MNVLGKLYGQLTAEERFRLIVAASDRGDDAERERLVNAGKWVQLTMQDHSPYSHAFQELIFLTYTELLEEAAQVLETCALTDTQLRDSIDKAQISKRKKASTPKGKGRTQDNDAVEYPAWNRTARTASAVGFLFNVKVEGWSIFCARHHISPFALWEQMDLPGVDRIKRALGMAHAGAMFPSAAEMTTWMNEVRPASAAECTEADILTAVRFAANLDATFHQRAKWWSA